MLPTSPANHFAGRVSKLSFLNSLLNFDVDRFTCGRKRVLEPIRVIAELDDRTVQDEVRNLIRLGLQQKLEMLRTAKLPRNLLLAKKRLLQLFGEDA